MGTGNGGRSRRKRVASTCIFRAEFFEIGYILGCNRGGIGGDADVNVADDAIYRWRLGRECSRSGGGVSFC